MRYIVNSTGIVLEESHSFMEAVYKGDYTRLPDSDTLPEIRHITVGSFFDRFEQYKYQILASSSPAVQALIKDCSVRKYIDLNDKQLALGLDMLIHEGFEINKFKILNGKIQSTEEL